MTETHSINWQGLLDLPDPVKERAAKAIGRTIGVPWSSEIEETAVVLAQFASGEKVDETLGVQALRVVEADLAVLGRASSRLLAEAVLTADCWRLMAWRKLSRSRCGSIQKAPELKSSGTRCF